MHMHKYALNTFNVLALADTGAQVVAGGPGLAHRLGVNCNELIPVTMNTITGVAGHARVSQSR